MTESLPVVVTALVWLAWAYQVRVVRSMDDPARGWLVGAFLALALALTINLDPVYKALDALTRQPNLGELVVHSFVLVAGWSAQGAVLHFLGAPTSARPGIRLRAGALAVALMAMTYFFLQAPVDVETTEFTIMYATTPSVVEYWLTYLAYLAFALIDLFRMAWRYSKPTGGLVGTGLRILAAGAVCGLAYVAHKAAYVSLRRWTSVDLSVELNAAISNATMLMCVLLIAVSKTLPRWGARVVSMPVWVARLRAYRRLAPLWSAVAGAFPDRVLLDPSDNRLDSADPRNINFRLYRRVIEIRDGQMELRRYVDDDDVEALRRAAATSGLRGPALDAAVEAAALRTALQAKREGRPSSGRRQPSAVEPQDLDEEIEWLGTVAKHFVQLGAGGASPSVRSTYA